MSARVITPQQRLELLPFKPARSTSTLGWDEIILEDYRHLPPSDLKVQPMSYHIIALHYKPPTGILRHRCGGQWTESHMRPYDITYVPALMDNQWQFDGNHPNCLHILIKDSFVRKMAAGMVNQDAGQVSFLPAFQARDTLLQQLAQTYLRALRERGGHDPFYTETIGSSLAQYLVKHLSNSPFDKGVEQRLSNQQLARVLDYLQAHLDQPVTLHEMAGLINLSVYHFSRMFRNTLHQSPYQFLKKMRLEQARSLLIHAPQRPIRDIALDTGFSDQSHLTKHFRATFGLTPSAFRKRHT